MKEFDCPHCHRLFEGETGENEVVTCPHCNGTVEIPEEDLSPGTLVGGFEIIRLLGHGGMGNVYLANQVSMNRPVALKILLRSMTEDKESVKQFLNEAKVSGQMNHRNIITAIDAGDIDDRYYLVTTFVDGYDLEKRLEEEKIITEKETLQIAIKMANALQYAWESHGILHKDIKPANIMVDSGGEPYLMDMGIAQYIGEVPGEDEHIVGSPFYMSPEQTRAERLSWTSDLYSLGATMYNMVVGVPPYDADDVMKIIEMHSEAPFPMPKTRNPEAKVTKATVMILQKMMAKDPNERFDSWGGLKEALTKALRSGGKAKKATTKKGIPAKKTKRKRRPQQKTSESGGILSVIIIIALLATCLGAAVFFFNKHGLDKAQAYLDRAERYRRNHPGDYAAIVENFRQASKLAEGTSIESIAKTRHLRMIEERRKQEKLIKEYKETMAQVGVLDRSKRYQEAINLIRDAVKNIKDPDTKNQAEMVINSIKSKMK